eukprot:gnl/Chilomastix_cuspidata/1664.p1 GENE.gnl/Chilomastix_cuspidata/1664~~gnl/Chilomastix_cuspidata/1664.p1  ORF type:complete len:4880 (-),score=609.46 gnl/Chilomastix_cuspidata/1664:93-14435(-)
MKIVMRCLAQLKEGWASFWEAARNPSVPLTTEQLARAIQDLFHGRVAGDTGARLESSGSSPYPVARFTYLVETVLPTCALVEARKAALHGITEKATPQFISELLRRLATACELLAALPLSLPGEVFQVLSTKGPYLAALSDVEEKAQRLSRMFSAIFHVQFLTRQRVAFPHKLIPLVPDVFVSEKAAHATDELLTALGASLGPSEEDVAARIRAMCDTVSREADESQKFAMGIPSVIASLEPFAELLTIESVAMRVAPSLSRLLRETRAFLAASKKELEASFVSAKGADSGNSSRRHVHTAHSVVGGSFSDPFVYALLTCTRVQKNSQQCLGFWKCVELRVLPSEHEGAETLEKDAADLCALSKKVELRVLKLWKDKTLADLKSFQASGDGEGTPLICYDSVSGHLLVSQTALSVPLLRGVRMFLNLGYSASQLPAQLRSFAASASSVEKTATILQQIASFYNSQISRIHSAHKPSLLGPARQFEAAVKRFTSESKHITLASIRGTTSERTLRKLEEMTNVLLIEKNNLEKRINGLETIHGSFIKYFKTLPGLPFAARRNTPEESWAAVIKKMRDETGQLHRGEHPMLKILKPLDVIGWRTHWNAQLFRAFGVAWLKRFKKALVSGSLPTPFDDPAATGLQMGPPEKLNTITLAINEQRSDLVFTPTLFEIRRVLFSVVNEYIQLPANPDYWGLDGFSSRHEYKGLYVSKLQPMSSQFLSNVTKKLEVYTQNLSKLRTHFREHCAISLVDDTVWAGLITDVTPEFIRQNLKRIELLKRKDVSRTIQALPFVKPFQNATGRISSNQLIRIPPFESIPVNIAPVNNLVLKQPEELARVLCASVLKIVSDASKEIRQFVSDGSAILASEMTSSDQFLQYQQQLQNLKSSIQPGGTIDVKAKVLDEVIALILDIPDVASQQVSRSLHRTQYEANSALQAFQHFKSELDESDQNIQSRKDEIALGIRVRLLGPVSTSRQGFGGLLRDATSSFEHWESMFAKLRALVDDAPVAAVPKKLLGSSSGKCERHEFIVWHELSRDLRSSAETFLTKCLAIDALKRECRDLFASELAVIVSKNLNPSEPPISNVLAELETSFERCSLAVFTAGLLVLVEEGEEALSKIACEEWVYVKSHLYLLEEFIAETADRVKLTKDKAHVLNKGFAVLGFEDVPETLDLVGCLGQGAVSFQTLDVLFSRLQKVSTTIERCLPLLKLLKTDSLGDIHWKELEDISKGGALAQTHVPPHLASFFCFPVFTLPPRSIPPAGIRLIHLLDPVFLDRLQQIRQLVRRAEGQHAVRESIRDIKRWLQSECQIVMKTHKLTHISARNLSTYNGAHLLPPGSTDQVPISGNWRNVLSGIREQKSILESLQLSPFFSAIEKDATSLQETLVALGSAIVTLISAQNRFVYLEPVIGQNALPTEQDSFYTHARVIVAALSSLAGEPLLAAADEQSPLEPNNKPFWETSQRSGLSLLHFSPPIASIASQQETKPRPFARVLSALEWADSGLNRTEKALSTFLEKKRIEFSRFYYLSDTDLLSILAGATAHPETVLQPHLRKLFQAIASLHIQNQHITGFSSIEGEYVKLSSSVRISGEPEKWLNAFKHEVESTLQTILWKLLSFTPHQEASANVLKHKELMALSNGPLDLSFPGELVCLANSILFSAQVEDVFASKTVTQSLRSLSEEVQAFQQQISKQLNSEELRGMLLPNSSASVLRLKLRSLATDLSRQLDVLHRMTIKASAGGLDSAKWVWYRSVRQYLTQSGEVKVCGMNAELNYSWEYQGLPPHLVHTSLTTKCYTTLLQALAEGFGGNPIGPAGTGKTESVKALGVLLGRPVVVFNCDAGIDLSSLGRVLAGIVLGGAFGCFDEFNRLSISVLSAVSQDIQKIQSAVRTARVENETKMQKSQALDVGGIRIPAISPNAALFVTMNPASRQYGGRSELPYNLMQLLRPVYMERPDITDIAQVQLAVEGFEFTRDWARKCTKAYALAKLKIPPSRHLDWGLRALQTVFSCASVFINTEKEGIPSTKEKLFELEGRMIIQSLRQATLPRLSALESKQFEGILHDIFGKLSSLPPPIPPQEARLFASLQRAAHEMKLRIIPKQLSVCLRLYSALTTKLGVTLCGPPGSGKSTIRALLQRAIQLMSGFKLRVEEYLIAPKSMRRDVLLGTVDPRTREWSDGALTAAAKASANAKPADEHVDFFSINEMASSKQVLLRKLMSVSPWNWVVFDGAIDTLWVEALNSTLDDNRTLTLASGERIRFPSAVDPLQGFSVAEIPTVDFPDTSSPPTCAESPEAYVQGEGPGAPPTSFIFETDSLAYASPATVSRMAIIMVTRPKEIPIVSRTYGPDLSSQLGNAVTSPSSPLLPLEQISDAVERALRKLKLTNNTSLYADCVSSVLTVLEGLVALSRNSSLIPSSPLVRAFPTKTEGAKSLQASLFASKAFVAHLPAESRREAMAEFLSACGHPVPSGFDYQLLSVPSGALEEIKVPSDPLFVGPLCRANALQIPLRQRPCYPLSETFPLLPTPELIFSASLLLPLIASGASLLLEGPHTSGKIAAVYAGLPTSYRLAVLPCTSSTPQSRLVDTLRESASIGTLENGNEEWDCRGLVLILRDADILKPDEFDTVPLLATVWGIIGTGRVVFRDEKGILKTVVVRNIQFVLSVRNTGDFERIPISQRLKGRLVRMSMPPISPRSCHRILNGTISGLVSSRTGLFASPFFQPAGHQFGESTEMGDVQSQFDASFADGKVQDLGSMIFTVLQSLQRNLVDEIERISDEMNVLQRKGDSEKASGLFISNTVPSYSIVLAEASRPSLRHALRWIALLCHCKAPSGSGQSVAQFVFHAGIVAFGACLNTAPMRTRFFLSMKENLSRLGLDIPEVAPGADPLLGHIVRFPVSALADSVSLVRRFASSGGKCDEQPVPWGRDAFTWGISDTVSDARLVSAPFRETTTEKFQQEAAFVIKASKNIFTHMTLPDETTLSLFTYVQMAVASKQNLLVVSEPGTFSEHAVSLASVALRVPLVSPPPPSSFPGDASSRQLIRSIVGAAGLSNSPVVLRLTAPLLVSAPVWSRFLLAILAGPFFLSDFLFSSLSRAGPDNDAVFKRVDGDQIDGIGVGSEVKAFAQKLIDATESKNAIDMVTAISVLSARVCRNVSTVLDLSLDDPSNFCFFERHPDVLRRFIVCYVPAGASWATQFEKGDPTRSKLARKIVVESCFSGMPSLALRLRKASKAREIETGEVNRLKKLFASLRDLPSHIQHLTRTIREFGESPLISAHEKPPKQGATVLLSVARCVGLFVQMHFDHLAELRQRYETGLDRLSLAQAEVEALRKKATSRAKKLAVAQEEANAALKSISIAMDKASERRQAAAVIEERLKQEEHEVLEQKREAEVRLSEVQPILDAAKSSVQAIPKKVLSEIRSFAMPPKAINIVLSAVLILFGINELTWSRMRSFILRPEFKTNLLSYDVSRTSLKALARVREIVEANADAFEKEKILRVSKAAAPLAAWVLALLAYADVSRSIKPLEDAAARANARFQEAQVELAQIQNELQHLEEHAASLREDFEKKTSASVLLKKSYEETTQQLQAGNTLLELLSGEADRWAENFENAEREENCLVKKAVAVSILLFGFGGCPDGTREKVCASWAQQDAALSRKALFDFLVPSHLVNAWGKQGLSGVSFVENAAILALLAGWSEFGRSGTDDNEMEASQSVWKHFSPRCAFLLDQDGTAVSFVKRRFAATSQHIEEVSAHSSDLVSVLHVAAKFGHTVLVTEAHPLPPLLHGFLDPLFRRKAGSNESVLIDGAREVDIHPSFFVILAAARYPALTTTDLSRLVVLSFAPTTEALSDTFTNQVLTAWAPELLERLDATKEEINAKNTELKDLELELLTTLVSTKKEGILENTELVEKLTQTQKRAREVTEAVHVSEKTQRELSEKRSHYDTLGAAAAFVTQGLRRIERINPAVYAFSREFVDEGLAHVLGLKNSVEKTTGFLVSSMFGKMCAGVDTRDRATASLIFTSEIYPDVVSEKFLSALEVVLSESSAPLNPDGVRKYGWLPTNISGRFERAMEALASFGVTFNFGPSEVDSWKALLGHPGATPEVFPGSWPPCTHDLAKSLQCLLSVALFPHRSAQAIQAFAGSVLLSDPDCHRFSKFGLTEALASTSAARPLLLQTSPGQDPSELLRAQFGVSVDSADDSKQFLSVALSNNVSERLIAERVEFVAESGSWLLLQNAHLAPVLSAKLVGIFKKAAQSDRCHRGAKLIVSSEFGKELPNSLLAHSARLCLEGGVSLKGSLGDVLETLSSRDFSQTTPAFPLYSVAALHSVLLCRAQFTPRGFAQAYKFSITDVLCAASFVATRPENWKLVGFVREGIYGGPLRNAADTAVVSLLTSLFLGEAGADGLEDAVPLRRIVQSMCAKSAPSELGERILAVLPESDDPSLINLPGTALYTRGEKHSRALLRGLKSALAHVASRGDADGAETNMYAEGHRLSVMWRDLRAQMVDPVARRGAPTGAEAPLAEALAGELRFALNLCDIVTADLKLIETAAAMAKEGKPEGIPVRAVQLARLLTAGVAPEDWLNGVLAPPTPALSLGESASLAPEASGSPERYLQFLACGLASTARTLGRPTEPLPFAEFLRPSFILEGVRQEAARRTGAELDLVFPVATLTPSGPVSFAVAAGHFTLRGANVIAGRVRPPTPDADVELSKLPELHICFGDAETPAAASGFVRVPLYAGAARDCALPGLAEVVVPAEGARAPRGADAACADAGVTWTEAQLLVAGCYAHLTGR